MEMATSPNHVPDGQRGATTKATLTTRIGYRVEGTAARAAIMLMRALGPVRASNLGAAVARTIGPILPVSRIAHRNLQLAMPELDPAGRKRVVRGVWDNLGRTLGEFPHVGQWHETGAGPGWEIAGKEHLAAMVEAGGPGIMFTGHIGNWEILPIAAARNGVPFATIYRPSDNPEIDRIVQDLRRDALGADGKLFAKGAQGARQSLAHLRNRGFLALLPDQKMNDGIEARFFGLPAMTASAVAAMALRVRCPVVPVHTHRLGPARLRIVVDPPLPLPDSGNRADDVRALTQAINDRLEAWIRAWPEGWLWLHRRWPREQYPGL